MPTILKNEEVCKQKRIYKNIRKLGKHDLLCDNEVDSLKSNVEIKKYLKKINKILSILMESK